MAKLPKTNKKSKLPQQPLEPPQQPTKEDPFINQIGTLLKRKAFDRVPMVIKVKLESNNDLEQLDTIIKFINHTKNEVIKHNEGGNLSLFGKPPVISELDSLRQQAVTAKVEWMRLQKHNSVLPPSAYSEPTPEYSNTIQKRRYTK